MREIRLSGSGEGPSWATARPTLQRPFPPAPPGARPAPPLFPPPPLGSAPPWSALGSPCLREPSHAASVRQRLASSGGRQQATGRLARLTAAAGRPDRQDGL